MTRTHLRLAVVGGLALIVAALALGLSPVSALGFAVLLACPLVMAPLMPDRVGDVRGGSPALTHDLAAVDRGKP